MPTDNPEDQHDDAQNGEPFAVDRSMPEEGMRERHSELLARHNDLKAKQKSLDELDELVSVTAQLNAYAAAINAVTAEIGEPVEVAAPVVPDTVETAETVADTVETAETDTVETVAETVELDAELVAAAAAAAAEIVAAGDSETVAADETTGLGHSSEPAREEAPIMASAASADMGAGGQLTRPELGAALQLAMQNGAGRGGRDTIVASVNPYGTKADEDDNALGSDPRRNHELLHPDTPDYLSVTAAIGCADPEPPRTIPSCFNADEPVLDTLTEQRVQYGQVQLYDPSCLDPATTGLMIPGPECGPGCVPSVDLECAEVGCPVPNDPVKVIPVTACVCVPDDLQFSAPYVLDDQLNKLAAGFAKGKELWRLEQIREQSIVKQFTPPYGAKAGVAQAAAQIAALVKNNQRCAGDFSGYQLVHHGGDLKTVLADSMNRTWGVSNGLDDLFEALRESGISDFVEIIEHDDANSTTAAGPRPVVDPTLVGNANVTPLEPFYQTPTFYLYRKDSFITGSPYSVQLGFGDREKDELASGCSRMIMREYWLPPTHYGCRPSFVLDFTEFCASGSGPDRQTPVCAGSEPGGGGGRLA